MVHVHCVDNEVQFEDIITVDIILQTNLIHPEIIFGRIFDIENNN